MLSRLGRARGFSLIEMMIGLVVLGVLITLALPNFFVIIQNSRIRNQAESVLNGLQLAKAQAVRSNVNVEFLFTNGDPTRANAQGAVPTPGGVNWIVRNQTPISADGVWNGDQDFIQGKSWQEGARDPGAPDIIVNSPQGNFIFTPLGRLLNPPAADVSIVVDIPNNLPDRRRMCVIISTGGQLLMCDPNRVDASNPQFCPAGACPLP